MPGNKKYKHLPKNKTASDLQTCEFSQTLHRWWFKLVSFSFEISFKGGKINPRRDVDSYSFPSLVLTVSTNSLSNSLSRAGGIPSTFLSSTFHWRKLFSRLTFISVLPLLFLFSWSCMKSWIFPSGGANLSTSSSVF